MISESTLLRINSCKYCKTIENYRKFPSNSHGNTKSKYIIVSEAPGIASLNNNRYWTGKSGKILRNIMKKFNKELEDVFYLTDIVKCWPCKKDNNRKPLIEEVNNCSEYLETEINELEPKLIIAFGKTVAEYLLKENILINEKHNKIFEKDGMKILVLHHPSFIDVHMKRSDYIKDVTSRFSEIIDDGYKEETKEKSMESTLTKKNNSQEIFQIPAIGNKITETDIRKGYIRITKDNKKFFPEQDKLLFVKLNNQIFEVQFVYKNQRSHILKLSKNIINLLSLGPGDKIKIKRDSNYSYEIFES